MSDAERKSALRRYSDEGSDKMYDRYNCMDFERSPSGLLKVTFNRPRKLNSLDGAFHRELSTFFADVQLDTETSVVVLSADGPAFCAGGDLDWMVNEVSTDPETTFREARKIVVDMLEVSQPIISAVQGAAAGFGLTMALLGDFSYVAKDARLSDPHAPLGLGAGDGGALTWPFLVGMARAKRYLLTGDAISGQEAAEMGLVTAACDPDKVLATALEMGERLAQGPRLSIQGTKRTLNALMRHFANFTLDVGLQQERVAIASEEHKQIMSNLLAERQRRRDVKRLALGTP